MAANIVASICDYILHLLGVKITTFSILPAIFHMNLLSEFSLVFSLHIVRKRTPEPLGISGMSLLWATPTEVW